MRLITAIGCCLLLATFITANPDVSHLKYTRRPYKKHLTTTTSTPNTKSYTVRKESTYAFKPKLINRKGLRNDKLTTEILITTTTTALPPTITTILTSTTVAESVATQTTTTTTTEAPMTMSTSTTTSTKPIIETTENDDSLSVINNSDSISSSGSDAKRSERDGKSLQDAWDIRHNIPGEPGVDYPIYFKAPDSKFDCENRHDGYYADTEARCQVFHVCANTALEERGFIFLCPNGTVFSQENFVCDWYTNVNCPESEKYYYKNEELGKFIGSKEEMLLEVQKMFNYTLRNLLSSKGTATSNEHGGNVNGGSENDDIVNSNTKNSDSKNSDSKNSDSKNSDSKNSDSKNSDSKNSDSKNSDSKNSDSKNGKTESDDSKIGGDENSITRDKLDLKFGNFPAIPILNPKMRKPSNKTKGSGKTGNGKDEVYISNLGELSTDPGADFDINVVKMQAKLKSEAANKNKIGSFSELWGQDIDQLDAILSQNRLKKSSDGKLFIEVTGSTPNPSASTVTKRDVSHLFTTTEYLPPNRYLPSLRKINLRPQTGYYYEPTKPEFLTETTTMTESPINDSTRRTRPTTTKRVYTKRPTPTKTTIVTPEILTTTESVATTRRPTFKFEVTDKSESLLEYRGNFQTTEKLRGDQKPDDDSYSDIIDFESRKENPTYQSSTNEIFNESPLVVDNVIETAIKTTTDADNSINTLFVLSSTLKNEPASLADDEGRTNFPSISSTERNSLGDKNTINKEVTMMKRPIIILMAPYKINRTMDEKLQIVKVTETTKQTKSNLNQNKENVMVVFASGNEKPTNSGDDISPQKKIIIDAVNQKEIPIEIGLKANLENESTQIFDDMNELNSTGGSGSILFLPPFGDEQSTISSILKHIEQSGEREGATVRISTDIIDLENQDFDQVLFDPERLNIRIRPEIEQNESDYIESTTVRIDSGSKVELSELEDVHTNNRDDRLALIQKMIKILEQKMKLKLGDLPDSTTEIFSRFPQTTTTTRPVTQFSLDNIIKETNTTQSQGVGANLIFAMMKILENAQNKTKVTINARPGDGPLEPIFSSLTNAQTESPIKIRDEDILSNEDILSKTINLLQNSDNDELKSILEVNEIEQIRKNGNLVFLQTTPKSVTNINQVFQTTEPNTQIDEQVQNRFEMDLNPQIMIKEILRNGNSNVKQVDHTIRIIDNRVSEPAAVTSKPIIKSIFDSQSINRLSETSTMKPTSDALTSRFVEPASPNVVKFTFGTQINNVPNTPSQMTRISEVLPINKPVVLQPTFDSRLNNQVAGQLQDISKIRISEASPINKSPFDSQHNTRAGDSSLSISKTRITEVEPARRPTMAIPKPILTTVYESQQNNDLSEPSVSISKTRLGEVEPTRGPISATPKSVIKTEFDLQPNNRANEISQPISKTRISEVVPLNQPSSVTTKTVIKTTHDSEQNNDLSEPTLSISKTRIAAVEPAKEPNTGSLESSIKIAFDSQKLNRVSETPQPISKTRISETTPLNGPSSIISKTTVIKTTFDSSPNNLDDEPSLAIISQPISKTRISEVVPLNQPASVATKTFIKTTHDSEQNNDLSEPSLSISKTRIAAVEPAKGPNSPSPAPGIKTAFDTQQLNRVSETPQSISKTRISETTPLNGPSSIMSKATMIKTTFYSSQNNQEGEPSLAISKSRVAEVEPIRETFTVSPKPAITTTFVSQQDERLSEPIVMNVPSSISKPLVSFSFGTQINNEPGIPSQVTGISETTFDTQQKNREGDSSLSISKTRIAEVQPLSEPSTVAPKSGMVTSFDSQQNNRGGDSSLSISKTRLAAISPASKPSTNVKPQEQFSFGAEINNLVNDPSPVIPKSGIKSVSDQQVTRISEVNSLNVQSPLNLNTITNPTNDLQLTRGSDDGQLVTPTAGQNIDEDLVRELFDTNFNDKDAIREPMTIKTITRTNGGRTVTPNVIQTVPETQHKLVKIDDQDISDLNDGEVEESDTNARVEGKFTGFLNNNPDQNNIGVKSKGYIYENKLSPEVLRIYNINDIAYPSGTTFKPIEPVSKTNSVSSFSQTTARPIIRTSTFVSSSTSTTPTTTTRTTPRPTVISTMTTRKPLPITTTITTTTTPKPIVLTTPVPRTTTNAVRTATVSQAPLIIRVEDSIGDKPISVSQNSETREVFVVSNPNQLAAGSTTTTRTTAHTVPITVTKNVKPTVLIQKTEIETRTQEPIMPSSQIRPQIAIKTTTQKTVSTLQPRPQFSTSHNPTLTVHQNLLKQFPDIVITPSISQSLGQVVTQGQTTPQRVSINPSKINTEQTVTGPSFPQSFGTGQSLSQYPIPSRQSTVTTLQQPSLALSTNTPFRGVTNQPIKQQQSVFPNQQFVQPQQDVFGLQDAQARRPVQEQHKIAFPNQRPQFQPTPNQFIQSQQGFNQLQSGQAINQPFETQLLVDRPVPEPAISSQFPFGTEQQVSFNTNQNNGFRGKDSVIVNIVPSINWYLNDAKDRNSYFAAIQRGLIPNENTQFNQGHLRYGVPPVFKNRNSFEQQQPNFFQNGNSEIIRSHSRVIGAQEHARQSEFPFPNINRIPLVANFVQNSNRRSDDSNTLDAVANEKDSVFRGLSSYNVPQASVGKLPSDSDSVSGVRR